MAIGAPCFFNVILRRRKREQGFSYLNKISDISTTVRRQSETKI